MSVAKSQIFISGNLEGLNCTEKSVSDLIKALSIIVSEIPNAKLSIYGSYREPSYKDKLMQLIKSLELKKKYYN